jgi:hypothetical protein
VRTYVTVRKLDIERYYRMVKEKENSIERDPIERAKRKKK